MYMQDSNIKRTLNGSVADNGQVCSYLRKIAGLLDTKCIRFKTLDCRKVVI